MTENNEKLSAPLAHSEFPGSIPSRFGEPLATLVQIPNETPPSQQSSTENSQSFYDAIGGHDVFVKLVKVFYRGIEEDSLLRPMYPEEDLAPAERRMLMFLEQYWGGPTTYSEERGHPRLRMRHAPFSITAAARDAWLARMRCALDSLALAPLHEATLWDYLERAAHSMVNSA